jgi:hypothetical protein
MRRIQFRGRMGGRKPGPASKSTKSETVKGSGKPRSTKWSKKRLVIVLTAIAVSAIVVAASYYVLVRLPESSSEVVISDKLRQPEEDSNLSNVTVNDSSITYTYSTTPGVLNFSKGDYVVGITGFGYLRKVLNVDQNANTVVLTTQNASLAEVIQEGSFHLEHELTSDQITSLANQARTAGIANVQSGGPIVTVLGWSFDVGRVKVNVTGTADFEVKFIFESEFNWWTLHRLKLAVQTTMHVSLEVQTSGSVTVSKEKNVTPSKHFNPIVFWVGALPIVVVPELSVGAGVSLALQSPNLTASISETMTATSGFEYVDGQISPIGDLTHQETYGTSGTMSGNLTGYAIAPRLTLLLYGVAGPYVDLRPYLKFNAETSDQSSEVPWTLSCGIKGTAGVRLNSALDLKIKGSIVIEIFNLEWPLTEGVFNSEIPRFPSAPSNLVAAAGDGQISLSWQGPADNGSSPVEHYRIYNSTTSGSETFLVEIGNVLMYTHTGLKNGITCFYRIAAVNAWGEGVKSNEVSATPLQAEIIWKRYTIDASTQYMGIGSSIAVDANGKVHISYTEIYGNNYLRYATNAGGSWATSVVDTTATYDTSIAVDSNNILHIAYSANGLKYATNLNGIWSTTLVDATRVSSPSVAVDSGNRVHIAYYDVNNSHLKYATNEGGSWLTYTIDGAAGVGSSASIALDSTNKVHISYKDSTNRALKYATNATGSWLNCTIDGNLTDLGGFTSIAADSHGNVHISYTDYMDGHVRYATNAGGSWSISVVDGTSAFGYSDTSIAVDSNDMVHIVYVRTYGGSGIYWEYLMYATNAFGGWSNFVVDNTAGVCANPSIALDSTDHVHMSYQYRVPYDWHLEYATNS